ncbi:hypothetical protein D1872_283540 [compost metagenome]
MGYVMSVSAAAAGEEHQIAGFQIRFGDGTSHFRLSHGCARQVDAILAENTLRKRRAIKYSSCRSRCAELIRSAHKCFSVIYDLGSLGYRYAFRSLGRCGSSSARKQSAESDS